MKILAWHFIRESRTLGYDARDMAVEPGYIYSIDRERKPDLCDYGMHGSRRAIDALLSAPGPIVCRVRIWGDVQEGTDKLVGRHREVLWMADTTEALHRFAVWAVRNTPLADGRTVWDLLNDERSRRAVEVKERWIDGNATNEERSAAISAAISAAWSAASSAAISAARSAAKSAQNKELERMLCALK